MQKLLTVCLLLAASSHSSMAQKQWKLVWSDEFNYTGLPDSAKWNYDTGGHGWGNNELQFYTARRLQNVRVAKGKLIIEARKENWDSNKNKYTSARLVTKGKGDPIAIGWQHGRIEVKAKLPEGLGSWPAIWMLAGTTPLRWPDDGEIDIMEHVGYDPGKVHASVHCKKYYHSIGTQKTGNIAVPDFSKKFHVYSVEWNADSVNIAVDGKSYFHFTNEHTGYEAWPFDNKMYLLLNIAVGGNWGGQKGIDEKILSLKMEVDYVRVWQEAGGQK